MRFFSFLSTTLSAITLTQAATPAEWRSRSIYQVLTDRFALESGSATTSCDTSSRIYCGGTWQGLINKLDYIQNMGFTAVWVSPVVTNIEDNTAYGYGYHGYWAEDLTTVNSHFGDAADLKALSDALHDRDMYLMVDVAPNHFASVGTSPDYSLFKPFGSSEYFNSFCWITDYSNQDNVEDCWLGDSNVALVDVETELSSVQTIYNSWISSLVNTYSIDGLRIDTAKHVDKTFWSSFNDAAGVYAVGEVYDGDRSYTCGYQSTALDGVLNYPIYYPLLRAFQGITNTMAELVTMLNDVKNNCPDSTLLGTFSENHDIPRFASYTSDLSLARNLLAFNILADGLPIIYAGQEQRYTGASDPANREATWLSGYNTAAPLYIHIASLNQIRNYAIATDGTGTGYLTYKNYVIYQADHSIAMRKGNVVTVVTNVGASDSSQTFSVTNTPYAAGASVVDVLSCATTTIVTAGTLPVSLIGGLPKVFYPAASLSGSGICDL